MIQLYLQLLKPLESEDLRAYISLRSIFPLFFCRFLNLTGKVKLIFVLREDDTRTGCWINLRNLTYQMELNPLVSWVSACELPSLKIESVGMSGFCCVCR